MMDWKNLASRFDAKERVFIVGSAFIDWIVHVERLPLPGDDIYAHEPMIRVGGCALNVADVFAKAEVSVDAFLPIGRGPWAALARKALQERKLPVHRIEGRGDNGVCITMVDASGERTFVSLAGIRQNLLWEDLMKVTPTQYDWGYLSGYQLEGKSGALVRQWWLSEARGTNWLLALGPMATRISKERWLRLAAAHPIVTVNETEALALTKTFNLREAILSISRATKAPAIVTVGPQGTLYTAWENGQWVIHERKTWSIPVEDTIGSGDAHAGGFLLGQICGLTWRESIVWANATAAYVTMQKGGASCAHPKRIVAALASYTK